MNKWKIALWICFTVLLFVSTAAVYSIADHGISLSYLKVNYSRTRSDLDQLRRIINQGDLSKPAVQQLLLTDGVVFEPESDSIKLNENTIIFKDNRLIKSRTGE
jgi:hypothetical protein